MATLGFVVGMIIAGIIHGIGTGVFGPTSLTIHHTQTPKNMLGRVNSIQRFFMWGAIPLGSLAASYLTYMWGLNSALWFG